MYRSFLRLHQNELTLNSLDFFMNKIDICSTGGVKTQKCEQTITRCAKFFHQPKIFSNSVLKTSKISKQLKAFQKKLKVFPKKLKDFPKKPQCFGGYHPHSASKKMFKKLA